LKATLYIENGPPWISRISGYFFAGSNDGGLTIQTPESAVRKSFRARWRSSRVRFEDD